MNRDTILRAQIRWLLLQQKRNLIEHIHHALIILHPTWPKVPTEDLVSSSQINALHNALAWHQARPAATRRVAYLEAELDRLYRRAWVHSALQSFLVQIHHMIWGEGNQLWNERKQEHSITADLPLPWANLDVPLDLGQDEQARWCDELRLALADTLLHTLITCYATRPLQVTLVEAEGVWQWP